MILSTLDQALMTLFLESPKDLVPIEIIIHCYIHMIFLYPVNVDFDLTPNNLFSGSEQKKIMFLRKCNYVDVHG